MREALSVSDTARQTLMRTGITGRCSRRKESGSAMTQQKLKQEECQILISSVQDFLARHSLLPENGEDLKMPEEPCSLKWPDWLQQNGLLIFSLKTYPDCCRMTKAGRFTRSSARFQNWGIMWSDLNSRRGRVGHEIAHTLTTGGQQGTIQKVDLHFVDLSSPPLVTEEARCLVARQNNGVSNRAGERSGVLKETGPRAVLTPQKEKARQNGRRMKEPEEPMFTITATDRHGVIYHGRIRRLTPRECFRLQGYHDSQIDQIIDITSDSQLYKQAGNGVTVNVVEAIGRNIRSVDEELKKTDSGKGGDILSI